MINNNEEFHLMQHMTSLKPSAKAINRNQLKHSKNIKNAFFVTKGELLGKNTCSLFAKSEKIPHASIAMRTSEKWFMESSENASFR